MKQRKNIKSPAKKPDTRPEKKQQKLTGEKISAPCPFFTKCGGCQLQDRSYQDTLFYKDRLINELLHDFGTVKPIIGMKNPWGYRNKSHSTFVHDKRFGIQNGLYEEYSHKLVPIDRCLIQDERADRIVATIKSMMKSFRMTAYSERTGQGFLRHVLIKVGFKSGEVMVVLIVTSLMFPGKKNFVKALREKHPEISTIIQNINDKDTTMVLGQREVVLYGKGYIQDSLLGMNFQISAKSFYQINPVQTEVLYRTAMDMAGLTGKEVVLDAYAGIGTIGLIASREAKKVIGIELNGDAVKDARKNGVRNKVANASFYKGDAGEVMVAMAKEGVKLDVVFMDPPRSGSTKPFIKAVGKARPKKVVYISCGPETLARDLGWLKEEGYTVKAIQPVDMFPWTEHVECCVSLERDKI